MEDTDNSNMPVEEVIEQVIAWTVKQGFSEEALEMVYGLRKRKSEVRRTIRDSIFTHLFRHRRYVLELYKDLHPEDTCVTEEDIRIITIENVLTNGIHNDLGFSVRGQLFILVEAQTKWSENIVLRELQYLMESWNRYLWQTQQDVYQPYAVTLPEPQLYALFPEIREGPEKLTLADVYFPGKDSVAVDCCVNCIYADVAERGSILGQYARCAQIAGEELHRHGATPQAVEAVIRRCKEENVLSEFIERIRGEMVNIFDMMTEEERQEHVIKAIENSCIQKGRQEGIQKGRQEGIQEGIQINRADTVKTLLNMGVLSNEQIAEATRLSVQEVRQIAEQDSLS